jgi:hypothetical protein
VESKRADLMEVESRIAVTRVGEGRKEEEWERLVMGTRSQTNARSSEVLLSRRVIIVSNIVLNVSKYLE